MVIRCSFLFCSVAALLNWVYQIIQPMTSTATNAKNFKFHWVSSFNRVPLACETELLKWVWWEERGGGGGGGGGWLM